jgi:hypothetical protein
MTTRSTRREFIKRGTIAAGALSFGILRSRSSFGADAGVDPAAIKKLGSSFKGRLILPGDHDYYSARKIWNAKYDRHPAMIARCATAEDVVRSVEFAHQQNLAVSIRSGGHDQAGYSTNDGGMVIDLGGLNEIKVDRERKTVVCGGGVLVGELYAAVTPTGMGVVSGGCASVGIGGLTLGGGQSGISSKYGLACDNVISMEVVTADGRLLFAQATEHPDLFWALRGGSGNFGVVTRFEYRLVPGNRLLAGTLTYPIAKRREVMRFHRDFISSAPDELTTYTVFGIPLTDDVFGISATYCGDLQEGEKVLNPLRSFGPPVADSIKAVPFVQGVSDDEPAPLPNCAKDGFFSPFSDDAIDAMCVHLENPPPVYQTGIFDMHGAACRGDSAFPLRRPALDAWTWGFWRSDAERDQHGRMGRSIMGRCGKVQRRRLRQRPRSERGGGPDPRRLRSALRSPRRDQEEIRSGQLLPHESEHQTCQLKSGREATNGRGRSVAWPAACRWARRARATARRRPRPPAPRAPRPFRRTIQDRLRRRA